MFAKQESNILQYLPKSPKHIAANMAGENKKKWTNATDLFEITSESVIHNNILL